MPSHDEIEIDKIILPPSQLAILRKIEQSEVIPDTDFFEEPYARMSRLGLIERCYSDRFPYTSLPGEITIPENAICITDKGRLLLAWVDAQDRNRVREGRRYWITTSIAILALILSGIALAAQSGLIELLHP